MSQTWTTEQIIALAPDSSSASAGRGLANNKNWVTLGRSEEALWGECQGSGSKPYQTQIALSEPAFRCSCPSRKFPCKHGIGLFLIYAGSPDSVKPAAPPAWVAEWLEKRGEKAEKKQKAAAPDSEKSAEEVAKAALDQAKRAALREKKVARGLEDLNLWMRDLVRQGIAALPSQPYRYFDDAAARMVDAQAPGVARMLREMASLPGSGDGWQERMLERLGSLTLLIEAYQRLDSLPESVQADVRDTIGWKVRQETVLSTAAVTDLWVVLGQRAYEEEQFKVVRTWLRGQETGRDALLLNFVRQGLPQEPISAVGTAFHADLTFFPGSVPFRAVIKERHATAPAVPAFSSYGDAATMLSCFAQAVARNPWLEVFPAPLENMVPVVHRSGWTVCDAHKYELALSLQFAGGWKLLAVSGGRPITVFGEWDGAYLMPVCAWADGRLIPLP